MTTDPTLQALEDARTMRMVSRALNEAMRKMPNTRLQGIARSNSNGYRDEAGDFQEYWIAGDVVTDDGTGSNTIAP